MMGRGLRTTAVMTTNLHVVAKLLIVSRKSKIKENKHTSIQAARRPLTGRALEMWSGSVNHGAGLAGLGLSSAAVAKLRSQSQELPGSGGRFCGRQPETTEFTSLHNVLRLVNSQKHSH